jgi:hypothetical protein
VNQICPSVATATARGATVVEPSVVGVLVNAPVTASIRPRLLVSGSENQALPAASKE